MSICALHQIRIAALEREVAQLKKCADVIYMKSIEAENAKLRRIAEAAQIFNDNPNAFTHEILQDALKES